MTGSAYDYDKDFQTCVAVQGFLFGLPCLSAFFCRVACAPFGQAGASSCTSQKQRYIAILTTMCKLCRLISHGVAGMQSSFLLENLFQVVLRFAAHSFSMILCTWHALTNCTVHPKAFPLLWRVPSDSAPTLMHHQQRYH